ncbi:glutathione S-transferase family protein [Hyalangium gracile]|uniref:glutathione S-transferase family protein n=1 Tax=Hyalangium gracile TaxID=394092 RepID=UPI001CCD5B59|nr:glutathione S-transferase family protein [Hyalangium gracile]
MKLYYFPQTRGLRARWMLEELAVPYEGAVVNLMKGEQKQPAYLQVHPLGVVPALVDEGQTIIESAAIVMHLADKFPEKGFAPAVGTLERAQYYQWILYAMTEMDPHASAAFVHSHVLPEAQRSPAVVENATKRFKVTAAVVEAHLKGREFLVGNKFSGADVVMGGVLLVASKLGLLGEFPALQAYLGRLVERPAAKKAFA